MVVASFECEEEEEKILSWPGRMREGGGAADEDAWVERWLVLARCIASVAARGRRTAGKGEEVEFDGFESRLSSVRST